MMHVFKNFLYSTYTRLVIFLFVRGIYLPGANKIKRKMGAAYEKFERQKLIHDIKYSQLHLRQGPIWLRMATETFINFFGKNKFIILIFLKISLSLALIAIPIGLFVLLRGVLPVPERVPYEVPAKTLEASSNLKVDFPYTENNIKNQALVKNFGIGFLPFKSNIIRGVMVTDTNPVILSSSMSEKKEHKSDQRTSVLRIGYYLQPSGTSKQNTCILQIFNQKNELLDQITAITPIIETNSKYSIRNSWRKAFTPNILPSCGQIGEIQIPINTPPEQLILRTFNPNKIDTLKNNSAGCQFIVSDLSFEHQVKKPLRRRGVILIVIHSLRANTAYDIRLMKKLNKYMQNNSLYFLEHRVQSNHSESSMLSLLSSQYTLETKQNSFNTSTHFLPLALQNLGYRVGAIGSVSQFTDTVPTGRDIGIHNAIAAEVPRYEARYITELSGQWLEQYGNAPFFLMLYYYGMDNPFKPPSEQINLFKLMQNPFGLNQKTQFYKGLAKYFDEELNMLFQKLKTLGILEYTDIIITADHGVQLDQQKWNFVTKQHSGLNNAAYATFGHSLFDEEIRVPLIIKIAGHHTFAENFKITTPSAQLDLFPTLYEFMGGKSKNISTLGLNFSSALLSSEPTKKISSILAQRKTLFLTGQKYSGLISWDLNTHKQPIKYVQQLASDEFTLYLTQAPWTKKLTWYEPELFTKLDFENHSESWSQNEISDYEKNEIRKLYNSIKAEYQ